MSSGVGRESTTPTVDAGPAPAGAARGGDESTSLWLMIGPLGFVLVLLVLATAYTGAFPVSRWAPPTLFALLMLGAMLARGGGLPIPDRGLRLALVGAWGWAGWAVASAVWAALPDAALEGAGRQVLYAAVLTVPVVAAGPTRGIRIAAGGVVVGICAIAAYTLVRTIVDGPAAFLAGRLNDPVQYRNATALLFCLAYWPLIVAAATRERGRALRAACFAFAVMMLGLAFLTQSRGVALGLACGAVVALGLGPDRIRRAWVALLSAGVIALAAHWLLRPYHAFAGGAGTVTAHDIAVAGWGLVAACLAGGALMTVLAVFDNGLRPHTQALARTSAVARIGLAAIAAVGVIGALVVVGDPVHAARVRWDEFKSLQTTSTSTTRYSSAGGQRYDLWRVALRELGEDPILGVGQSSYQVEYYRLRQSNRNLDDPHGLLFQVGAELGVVGLVLCLLIPLGVASSMRRHWSAATPPVRRLSAGLAAAGATFLGQSLVDWMFRIPGVTGLGLLCLVLAACLLARADHPPPAPPLRTSLRLAGGLGLLAATLLVLGLYVSDFYANQARAQAGRSPAQELHDARVAEALDPLWVRPHYLEASALESTGDRASALAQLQEAQRLEPGNFVPVGLIGDWYARGGDLAAAKTYYRRALALNPLDSGLAQLARTGR